MPVNWQDKAVQDRLLTAVIASVNNKINVAEIARLYGQEDMTYHAVENYLRKFRKEAKAMMAQPSGDDSPPPSTTTRKKKNESPTKSRGVKKGRVTKPKKAPAAKVKAEMLDEESMYFANTSNNGSPDADEEGEDDDEMLV